MRVRRELEIGNGTLYTKYYTSKGMVEEVDGVWNIINCRYARVGGDDHITS